MNLLKGDPDEYGEDWLVYVAMWVILIGTVVFCVLAGRDICCVTHSGY